MTDKQLEPCRFCSSQAISITKSRFMKGFRHYGYCNDCHTTGPQKDTEAEATDAWNTRQPTQSDAEIIAENNFHKLALSESFERVAKVAEERAAFNAGIEADAKKCDCAAREERECACGAWYEWKSISSQRAIELVRALQELSK